MSWTDLYLAFLAFVAGLVSSSVGGGGLVLIPALFNAYPLLPSATVLGTNRLVFGMSGASNVWRVLRHTRPPWPVLWPALVTGIPMAAAGSALLMAFPPHWYKPVLLVVMIALAIHTWRHPALGQNATAPRLHTPAHQQLGSAGAGAAAGLYLGFIGPASQSFLLLGFVHLFGFDFRRASECAQIVVNGLNLASLLWFIAFSHVVFPIGLAMGACSVAGAVLGSRLIRKGGNRLIRRLFLGLLVIEIGRFTFGLF